MGDRWVDQAVKFLDLWWGDPATVEREMPGLTSVLAATLQSAYEAGRFEFAERLVTIVDEEFGLQPVQDVEATFTALEQGLFERRRQRSEERVSDRPPTIAEGCEERADLGGEG